MSMYILILSTMDVLINCLLRFPISLYRTSDFYCRFLLWMLLNMYCRAWVTLAIALRPFPLYNFHSNTWSNYRWFVTARVPL